MSIARFSVRQSVFVNLVSLAILAFGIVSYRGMRQEVFPTFPLKVVVITTLYPGVAPNEIEREISIPIEEALTEIEEIRYVHTISVEGRSQIAVELYDHVEDTTRVVDDIEDEIDRLRAELPEDAEDPVVVDLEFTVPVVVYALSGSLPEAELKDLLERLRDRILDVPGIGRIQEAGVREREIRIEPDPLLLQAHGLSLTDVVLAVRNKNLDRPSGTVDTAAGEMIVKVRGQVDQAEELSAVILRRGSAGDVLRLGEVATVRDAFEDPIRIARVERRRAMTLIVEKTEAGDAITVKRELDRIRDEFEAELPAGASLTEYMDTARYIETRIRTMHQSFLVGLVLVVGVLCLFLNWRIALLTALGIPFSLAFGMLVYRQLGGSSNALSIFSVILVLGMLVDDGIVVAENVYRYIEKGIHPVEAAIRGTHEVAGAVVLAVLTTVAAFLPLLLTEGRVGEFLSVIPIVVSLCLVGSLIEALLALPSHVADLVPPIGGRRRERRRVLDFFIRAYTYLLKKVLRRRYAAVATMLAVSAGSIGFAYAFMDKVFLPGNYIDFFLVKVETTSTNSIERTEEISDEIERRLRERMPDGSIASLVSNVGVVVTDENLLLQRSNLAYLMVDVTEDHALAHGEEEIHRSAREAIGDVAGVTRLRIDTPKGGPPVKRDIEIRVLGPTSVPEREEAAARARLLDLADRVAGELRRIPGVHDVGHDFERGKPELRIDVHEDRAVRMGFEVRSLAEEVRTAYEGRVASRMRWSGEEVDVVVRLAEPESVRPSDLETLPLVSPGGESAPLGWLAEVRQEPGAAALLRYQRRPVITVTASVDEGRTTVLDAIAAFEPRAAGIADGASGYEIQVGGGNEDIALMARSMARAALVSLLLIYLILGTLFRSFLQPLVVMFIVPFSLVGVVVGLILGDQPISLLALLGTVALAGIVVNDSIVMVDFINQARRDGHGALRAVVSGARLRFRPILLTSVTTIFGLLPLAVGVSGQEEFLTPAALAILWGLTFSTVLTLFMIPSVYLIVHDVQRRLGFDPVARGIRYDALIDAADRPETPRE